MNRRNFLSTLVAAGAAATVSPLLAIPPSNSPAVKLAPKPDRVTKVTGPLIRIKAIDIQSDASKRKQHTSLIFTTKNGEIFTFRDVRSGYISSIKKVMPGGLVDVEDFRIDILAPRCDVYEQTARDQIRRITPPECRAEIEWREVFYT